MSDFRIAWRTAMGQPISQELRDARRGFDRGTVRRVTRAMRRGEPLGDPAETRLAVALAREQLRTDRVAGAPVVVFFGLIVVLWAVMGIHQLSDGHELIGAMFLGFAVWGTWLLVMRPRWKRGARRTLELNDADPHAPTVLAEPSRSLLWVGMALSLVFYALAFGLLNTVMDGSEVTPGNVVQRGLFFGILMTVANQLWLRRRHASR